jgi:hypothetical protein
VGRGRGGAGQWRGWLVPPGTARRWPGLRKAAITLGPLPVRSWEASSAKVTSRRWCAPSAARTGWGASAAHSAIAAIDRAPASTAAAARPRTATSGWRRPRAARGSGTLARQASRCGGSASWRASAWRVGPGRLGSGMMGRQARASVRVIRLWNRSAATDQVRVTARAGDVTAAELASAARERPKAYHEVSDARDAFVRGRSGTVLFPVKPQHVGLVAV